MCNNPIFTYSISNPESPGCSPAYSNFTAPVPILTHNSFFVAGKNKLFFLHAPILREQWYRNNKFDVIVLSQAPLYHVETYLNGNISKNLSIRNFDIVSDGYGIQYILSNVSNSTCESDSQYQESEVLAGAVTPTQLEQDSHSFAYIYEFNSTYDGLGMNTLSLIVTDYFLDSEEHQEEILSRRLSYDSSITETGDLVSSNISNSRPSIAFRNDKLNIFHISLGLVGLMLILVFANVWIRR